MAKISRETLTRNDKRGDILVALFGDNEGNGWRDLSNDERLFILDNYDLKTNPSAPSAEEYGKEKTKAVNEITRFVISGALVTLSPHKLDKILEIINANEVEGLSNFSLGDK